MLVALVAAASCPAAEELLANGGFEGAWRPNAGTAAEGTAEGQVPDGWEDVSTWSGASTRYTRVPGADGKGSALRLELVEARAANSVLQLRLASNLDLQAGRAYALSGRLRSPTRSRVELALRQHQEPRLVFWVQVLQAGDSWRDFRAVVVPDQAGFARFFVALRELGVVEVDDLSVQLLSDSERPKPQPPAAVVGVRCVPTRGPLLRHSDIVAMYQENDLDLLRDYRVDVVAWGGQLGADEKTIAARRDLIERATAAGIRLHAVDCAMVQEGSRCVVAGGRRDSPTLGLFGQLRRDNEATIAAIGAAGIDLTRDTVRDVEGNLVPVPWLRKRWRIPMASVYSPTARQWFRQQMDNIARTGATALHFDEPAMGAYGLTSPQPGDFSDHAMKAFREWLGERPPQVWRDAGIETLDGFDYRAFVQAHGGDPRRAPLWREFVRFQLFTTVQEVTELRDRVRAGVGHPVPLSMNANASSWIKLPFLAVQDYMTTEVAHEAKSRKVPTSPLLVYKLGDAFGQAVASTAHGTDWYEMKADQHPLLVASWLALGYASGHHLMMPCRAWVMDPVTGSDMYRPVSDEYRCVARFIKEVAPLLDGYEPVSVAGVVVGCDAIESDLTGLNGLARRLADANVPFSLAVEGNDLLDRRVSADDLDGCSAILLASPGFLAPEAVERVKGLAGARPVAEYLGGPLPGFLPRPIRVEGATGIWALPRQKPGEADGTVVVHLLNRDYDAEQRTMVAKGPFTLRLDRRLLGGGTFGTAVLHQPVLHAELTDGAATSRTEPIELRTDGDWIEGTVPRLELWGVLELRP